ncbi:tetratricopeptide repeat protein [Oceanicoccus sp. KOV_DT_Chl]|uniref:tetratricopeptide repeat protein n=1 Tax=Oceanicoccus sp. KOV_DT_Chl TaxID=1904639 RepID=UPI00135A9860|nr:tetratricopeptide repeat protein [Oceanicoccus sp. KOV_DT_Chl]
MSSILLVACGGEERQAEYLTKAQDYYDQENMDKAKIEVKNVLQINPNNADARYLLGLINESDQNFRGAFKQYMTAADTNKKHVPSLTKLAEFYLAGKDTDNAMLKAEEILVIDPNNADALGVQAAILASQGKNDEAVAKAQQALSEEPGHVQATTVLTALYAEENPELALQTITEGIANQSKNEALKQLKIRLLASQKQTDEVISLFEELIQEYPENFFYTVQLVNFHLADDRKTEDERKVIAEQILRDLVAKNPDEANPKSWLVEFLARNKGSDDAIVQLEEFLTQKPEDFKSRDQLAKFYVAKKEFAKAEALYQFVVNQDGESNDALEARNRLVSLAMAENDQPKAEAILKKIFEIEPENAGALLSRAKLRLAKNDMDAAIPDLRVVLKNDPESVEALSLLARAHEASNSPDLALDSYQRLLALRPKAIGALVGSAKILLAKNENKDALALLESAQKIDAANPEVVRLLVDLYSREQRWDDAMSSLAALTENEQTMAIGYYLKGRVLLRKKEYKPAVEALEKSHEIEPKGIETLNALLGSYVALEQMDKAFAYVQAHIEKYPEQLHAQESLGNLQARDGDLGAATKTYLAIIEKQPGNTGVYGALARIYAAQKKLDDVEALYLKGIEKAPENMELRAMLAELYQAQGNFTGAMNEYEAILKTKPDALVIKNNLASLLMDHANTPENLQRIASLSADLAATETPAFLDTAGWAQYQLGNYAQAVSLLGAAVEAGGKGAVYNYHLGMAYFKADMKVQAKEQLELALADDKVDFVGKGEAESVLGSL